MIDFVHPATRHDDNIVTLHSLLDRDVYRGGAIVVGPVRRGRGRRVRVEKRVISRSPPIPSAACRCSSASSGAPPSSASTTPSSTSGRRSPAPASTHAWRKAKAMLQHDQAKELRRRFLLTCIQRNRSSQLKLKALGELAATREAEPFDEAIDMVGTWQRDQRRAGVRVLLQALAEKRIGRRDQAQAWVWRLAEFTRDCHEEYAVQRWPETKRLLGLFVNSSGRAHGKNARRLVQAARGQDRRLAVALLAAAVAHTPEAEEVLRGARMRMARKPSAVARELLRNLPKGGGKRRRRRAPRRRAKGKGGGKGQATRARGRPEGRRGKSDEGVDAPRREDESSTTPTGDDDGRLARTTSGAVNARASGGLRRSRARRLAVVGADDQVPASSTPSAPPRPFAGARPS